MKLSEAQAMAEALMEQFELDGWQFVWMNSRRTFGQCRRVINANGTRQEIRLSKVLTAANNRPQVDDTLRHEIAHALAPINAGHGPQWRAMCAVTGARPQRCFGSEVTVPPARWTLTCETCEISGQRERKPRGTMIHAACGQPVTWTLTQEAASG